jgi:outer membrane protein assembly factor BamE (lipoprotein component of BamABCDE complex)
MDSRYVPLKKYKDTIMNTRKAFTVAIASLGLALAAQASFAASGDHTVTQDQIDHLRAGATTAEVTQTLGAPESVTGWMDGKHSMVYELSTSFDQKELVYVDLGKDGRMVDVQVMQR